MHGLTCNIFGVERIKREREKRLRVGLLPEFGSRVGIPENQRIRRMKSHQKVVGGILIGQPLQVWKCQNSRSGQGHSWNCKFSIIESNTCTTYIFWNKWCLSIVRFCLSPCIGLVPSENSALATPADTSHTIITPLESPEASRRE